MPTPSLRNFAVLRLVKRLWLGKVFEVQDRRLANSSQLLFVPNRLKSWPRYLAVLTDNEALPVRLRSGKVAILLGNNVKSTDLLKVLKRWQRTDWTFTALTGFCGSSTRKSPKVLLILLTCLLAAALTVVLGSQQSVSTSKIQDTSKPVATTVCVEEIKVGDKVQISRKKHNLVKHGVNLKILRLEIIGGYLQAQVHSICKNSDLQIKAWLHGKTYAITSVL